MQPRVNRHFKGLRCDDFGYWHAHVHITMVSHVNAIENVRRARKPGGVLSSNKTSVQIKQTFEATW